MIEFVKKINEHWIVVKHEGKFYETIDVFNDFGTLPYGYLDVKSEITHVNNAFEQNHKIMLKQKLEKHVGDKYEIFFVNSGSEATELALKFAYDYFKNPRIATLKSDFHGRTNAALSFSDVPDYYGLPFRRNHTIVNLEDISNLNADVLLADTHGCGDGDVVVRDLNYYVEFKKRHTDKFLVLDEVQLYMRTSKLFAWQEHPELEPDIFYTSKGVANGLPIGIVFVKKEIVEQVYRFVGADGKQRLYHHSTFGGNYISCQVAYKNLLRWEKGEKTMFVVQKPFVGLNYLFRVEFDMPANEVFRYYLENGFLISPLRLHRGYAKFAPYINIKYEDYLRLLKITQGVAK